VIRKACAVAEAEGFEGRKFVSGLFEALTYINDDRKHMPRSQTFAELLASFNSNEKALADVIDVFRHDDAAFLIAGGRAGITPTTLIDISHHVLIRRPSGLRTTSEDTRYRDDSETVTPPSSPRDH
jgi:hypothetical protein